MPPLTDGPRVAAPRALQPQACSSLVDRPRLQPRRLAAASLLPRQQLHDAHQRRCRRDCFRVLAASGVGGGSSGIGSGSGGGGGGSSGGSSSSGAGGDAHPLRLWTLAYAALLAAGGAAAYFKAGSTKSLSSAGGAALILALSARTMVGAQAKGSMAVCLAVALLLTVVMAGRYSRTRKLMPAGITAGVSVGMAAAYVSSLFG